MKRVPAWLWAAALLPRLALCVLAALDPSRTLRGDSVDYLGLAHALVERGVFSTSAAAPYAPQIVRTPGYPLFLAPFVAMLSSPYLAAAVAQSLLGAITVILAWRWFSRGASAKGAAFGALFLALDPVTVLHTPLMLSEALFMLLTVAAAALTVSALDDPEPRGAAAAGALWGLSVFVRPISLYLPATLALVWRRDKRAAAAFLLCAYLLPAGWTLRNWRATGHSLYAAVGGLDMLRYPAAGVESMRTGRPWAELEGPLRAEADATLPAGVDEAAKAQAYNAAAMKILRAHPFLLARYCAQGAVKLLAGTGLEMFLEWGRGTAAVAADGAFKPGVSGGGTLALLRAHPALVPLELAYVAALAALYLLAARGFLRLWAAGRRDEALLCAWIALYFLGLSSSQGYYRFRIPMMPFLAALAAAGLGEAPPARRKELESPAS